MWYGIIGEIGFVSPTTSMVGGWAGKFCPRKQWIDSTIIKNPIEIRCGAGQNEIATVCEMTYTLFSNDWMSRWI